MFHNSEPRAQQGSVNIDLFESSDHSSNIVNVLADISTKSRNADVFGHKLVDHINEPCDSLVPVLSTSMV